MQLDVIAHIHSAYPEKFGIPRQSGLVGDTKGTIRFVPTYRHPDAVRGLERFSHLWLIWDFSENHRKGWNATVTPPRLGGKERMGVFATRSPFRPNPLGLSSVKLDGIRFTEEYGAEIDVLGADLMDGTPIFDIKPYLAYTDAHPEASGGFTEQTGAHRLRVEIPEELFRKLPEPLQPVINELIAQDPRTAYIHDDSRVWGVSYGGWNIRFTVSGEEARVCEIEPDGR